MRKCKKTIFAAILVVVMLFTLCSCGNDADGTYVVESMGGRSVSELIEEYKSMGITDLTAEKVSKIVIDGDKFVLSAYGGPDITGTVAVSDDIIKVTIDGDTTEGTLKNGKLTFSSGGVTAVYKKK